MASNLTRIVLALLATGLTANQAFAQLSTFGNPPSADLGYRYQAQLTSQFTRLPPTQPVATPVAAGQPAIWTVTPTNPTWLPRPAWQPTPSNAVSWTSPPPAGAPAAPQHVPAGPTYSAPTIDATYGHGQYSTETLARPRDLIGSGCATCPPGDALSQHGFFVTYDYMYWTITPPRTTLIGHTDLEGFYSRGGVVTEVRNSFDTSFIDYEFHSGHRVEFGCMECDSGWLVGFAYGQQNHALGGVSVTFLPSDTGAVNPATSYFAGYFDGNGDGVDDDIDGDNIYGRYGQDLGTPDGMGAFNPPFDGTPDTPAPTDADDLQLYLPTFSEASVRNTVTLTNLEVMHLTSMHRQPTSELEFLYGVRYLDLEDYFAFSGTGGVLDATSFYTKTENQLFGLQIGARWKYRTQGWIINAEGRFLAAANMQDTKMQGVLASNSATNNTGQGSPINLASHAFNYTRADNEFAPLGELRLQALYPVTPLMSVRLGYTGFVAGGIGRASPKVQYTMPALGLSNAARHETVVFNSFTAGIEINR